MVKYQTANPFRQTLNENVPLILLLQVINLLRNDKASLKIYTPTIEQEQEIAETRMKSIL